jgi:cytochrome P450
VLTISGSRGYHWLPFGGGVNRCLGGHMAMFEARVLLRTILQEMTFVSEPSAGESQQAQTVLLLPKKRATVTLRRRSDLVAKS